MSCHHITPIVCHWRHNPLLKIFLCHHKLLLLFLTFYYNNFFLNSLIFVNPPVVYFRYCQYLSNVSPRVAVDYEFSTWDVDNDDDEIFAQTIIHLPLKSMVKKTIQVYFYHFDCFWISI